MSTKTLWVVGRGSGRQNYIPTIPTIPNIPTPWGCSKLKPMLPMKLKGPDNRRRAVRRQERGGEAWRRVLWTVKGLLMHMTKGAIHTIYYGFITRRVCRGGGPAGAAVWQCLCRRRSWDCCVHVPRGSVDNCRLTLREIVKLNGSGFGGGCRAMYVCFC